MKRRARCRHIIEADNSRTKDTLAQFSYPFGLHSFNCITPEYAFEHEARPIGTAVAEIAAARLNGPSGRVGSYPVEFLG